MSKTSTSTQRFINVQVQRERKLTTKCYPTSCRIKGCQCRIQERSKKYGEIGNMILVILYAYKYRRMLISNPYMINQNQQIKLNKDILLPQIYLMT